MAKNLFNSIKLSRPKKNVFDLTHDVKLSLNMGQLIPTMLMECIPGDKVSLGCESLLRFAPLVSPVMHRFDVTMHYYFVPNRILWDGWEKWIVSDPDAAEAPFFTLTAAAYTNNPLLDYMGLPEVTGANTVKCSALPLAAYYKVWYEYYRDQNLQDEAFTALVDGDNSTNAELFELRRRAWEHDYFTSALPFAQKGAAVDLPIGQLEDAAFPDNPPVAPVNRASDEGGQDIYLSTTGDPMNVPNVDQPGGRIGANSDLAYANLENIQVTPTTINDLRRAFRLQEWLERNARGGTRYIENILAHFGVRSSDKRMQRPEYITGTKSPVVISEVLNTTGTVDAAQGTMAGHGVSVTTGKYGKYFCEEHGYIIGIMSVMPKTAYQQGVPRHFLKMDDPFMYYWPSFANIGEQEIQNREIYADQTAVNQELTFGYVPRYAEYKYMPSRVAGDFKTTLNFWHEGRIFATPPALNADFVQCDPSNRIFAVPDPDEQKLYAQVLHKIMAVRPMPKYGNPMM